MGAAFSLWLLAGLSPLQPSLSAGRRKQEGGKRCGFRVWEAESPGQCPVLESLAARCLLKACVCARVCV